MSHLIHPINQEFIASTTSRENFRLSFTKGLLFPTRNMTFDEERFIHDRCNTNERAKERTRRRNYREMNGD